MTTCKKPYFPMFIDLSEKKVVVIGAGTIAKRRIRTLIEFTNHLTVVAPEVNPELKELESRGILSLYRKNYTPADIEDADIVIVATNDIRVNEEIYHVCKEKGITVNVCSDKKKCDFYFPGIAKKGQVVVGITATGSDHRKAKETTEKIRNLLQEAE